MTTKYTQVLYRISQFDDVALGLFELNIIKIFSLNKITFDIQLQEGNFY